MNCDLGQKKKKTSPGLESLGKLPYSSERQFSRKQLWVFKLTVPMTDVTLVTVTIVLVKPGKTEAEFKQHTVLCIYTDSVFFLKYLSNLASLLRLLKMLISTSIIIAFTEGHTFRGLSFVSQKHSTDKFQEWILSHYVIISNTAETTVHQKGVPGANHQQESQSRVSIAAPAKPQRAQTGDSTEKGFRDIKEGLMP